MPQDDVCAVINPEFSRPVDVTSFGAKGRHFKFHAEDDERRALAKRYSVLSVDNLDVECKITPVGKGAFKLNAEFNANVKQSCGISLDPVDEKISCKFTMTLKQGGKETLEIYFSPDEEDTELLLSNQVDMGEMIAQHLSLEINPYPRSQNATGGEPGQKIIKEEDLDLAGQKKNPFAVLQSLKHKT